MPAKQYPQPTFEEERQRWEAGYQQVAGIDEAGRGALAGPVVAAAVIAPPHSTLHGVWAAVNDSKRISPSRRSSLAVDIQQMALAWGVGVVEAAQIDQIGIGPATQLAMVAAVDALRTGADYLLIDWVRLPMCSIAQASFTKADQRIASVAAASILAKVHRDQLLTAMQDEYPAYGFAQHKGYGTASHLAAIRAHGPCHEHRHTFAPIANAAGSSKS